MCRQSRACAHRPWLCLRVSNPCLVTRVRAAIAAKRLQEITFFLLKSVLASWRAIAFGNFSVKALRRQYAERCVAVWTCLSVCNSVVRGNVVGRRDSRWRCGGGSEVCGMVAVASALLASCIHACLAAKNRLCERPLALLSPCC